MKTETDDPKAFTGRHMLLIMLAFFTVVIAVNVTMATVAGTSWTGFVVRNSYVASQEFNGRVAAARAQAELGWTASLSVAGGEARVTLEDRQGRSIPVQAASLSLRSPASDRMDRTVALREAGSGFSATVELADGQWVAEISMVLADGRQWHDTRRILLTDGRTR